MEHEMRDLCKLWKTNSDSMSGFKKLTADLPVKTGVLCIMPRYTVYTAASITAGRPCANKHMHYSEYIHYHNNPVYAVLDGVNNATSVTVRANGDISDSDETSRYVYWHGRVIDVMANGTIEEELYIDEIACDSLMLVLPVSHIPVNMFKKFTDAFCIDFPWMI